MKKILLWLLVLTMCVSMLATFSLAGCKKEAAPAAEEEVAAEEAEEVSLEGVTIYYISWADYTPEMLDLFKEQTGIILNYQQFGGGEYNEAVRTRVAGGGDLDVVAIRAEMRKEFFNDDMMVDLTGQPVLERVKDLSAGTSPDGKIYGIPIGGFVEAVWYNKDIFAKNNLSVPKNWEEFNDVCEKLKEAGITPLVEPFKDVWPCWYAGIGPLQRIYENDPKIVEKLDSGEVKWTDSIWVDALKEVESFIAKGYFAPESTGLAYMQAKQAFNDGQAAMTMGGTWNARNDTHGKDLRIEGFDLGVFPIPYNLPGEELKGIRVQGVVTGIAQQSKNKEAAIKFLEWITDPNGGAPIYHNTNGHPSNFIGFETDLGDFTGIIKEAQELPGVETLRDDLFTLVNSNLYTVLSEMYIGTKTAEEAAKALQDAQDKAMAEAAQ